MILSIFVKKFHNYKLIYITILLLLFAFVFFQLIITNDNNLMTIMGYSNANSTANVQIQQIDGKHIWKVNSTGRIPIILGWNDYYIFGNVLMMLINVNSVKDCPLQCEYTNERTLIQDADAIVYHINSPANGLPAGDQRSPNQFYVFFIDEIPQAHLNPPHDFDHVPPNFFNITMTFRTDSTIFYPYDAFEPFIPGVDDGDEKWNWSEVESKINAKKELALSVRSNCYTASRREKYIDVLKKYMSISEFGLCAGRFCDYGCYRNQLEKHYFFIAFENTVCDDYISEKFWNIKRLIVPVVLSRKVFANISNIPSDSFIAADDFSTAEELAKFLIDLSKDRIAYSRYFVWTKKYKKTSFHQILRPIHYYHQATETGKRLSSHNPMCNLCQYLHSTMNHSILAQKTKIEDIKQFWNPTKKCVDQFANKLLSNLTNC